MNNAPLLDSCAITNDDSSVVSPENSAMTNMAPFSYGNGSNYLSRGSYYARGDICGALSLKRYVGKREPSASFRRNRTHGKSLQLARSNSHVYLLYVMLKEPHAAAFADDLKDGGWVSYDDPR